MPTIGTNWILDVLQFEIDAAPRPGSCSQAPTTVAAPLAHELADATALPWGCEASADEGDPCHGRCSG